MKNGSSIKSFTDLTTWQQGHQLVLDIYRATKEFPRDEQFGLTSQIRRAAVSVTSNIAEGFSRPSFADKAHFYAMAQGSLTELQNQLLIAKDISYIEQKSFDKLAELTVVVHKLLTSLIKVTKEKA